MVTTGSATPEVPPEGLAPPEGDGFFVLRPEVMRHLPVNVYEGDLEDALEHYASAEGREQVFKSLATDKDAIARLTEAYPDFDLDQFSNDLNDLGILLDKEKEYYNDIVEILKTRQRFFEETVPGNYSFSEEDLRPSDESQSQGSPSEDGSGQEIEDLADDASGSQKEKRNIFQRAWDSIRNFPKNHPFVTFLLAMAAAAWGISKLWGLLANIVPVPNFAPAVGEAINQLGPAAAGSEMLEGAGLGGLPGPVGGGPGL